MIKSTLLLVLFCMCFLFVDREAISGLKEFNKSEQTDGIECLNTVSVVLSARSFNHVDKKKEIVESICNSHMTHRVPYELIVSVIWVESTFKPNALNGPNQGLMQINTRYHKVKNLRTIETNIDTGTKLLRTLLNETGSLNKAVSRYNGGNNNWKYIAKINAAYSRFFS